MQCNGKSFIVNYLTFESSFYVVMRFLQCYNTFCVKGDEVSMLNRKFKVSTILAIIALSILLLQYFINSITLIPYDRYTAYFNSYLKPYYIEIYGPSEIENFKKAFYMAVVVVNSFGLLLSFTGLILSIISLCDCKLPFTKFQKRKALHIVYVVFVGLNFIFSNVGGMVETYVTSFIISISIHSTLLLIALIFAIIALVSNKTSERIQKNYLKYGNDPFAKDENGNSIYAKEKEEEEKLHKEYLIKKQHVEEELKDTFEQLSLLEKSYKNGEISEEEYQLKKQSLFQILNEKNQ